MTTGRNGNGRNESAGDPRPDPVLGNVLRTLEPGTEILPWERVEQIVAAAPPVHVAWYAGLFHAGGRQLRYAMAPLALLLIVGVLWVMPAQSDQVGTLVLTRLPVAWSIGSDAFHEVQGTAAELFAGLDVPQSELYIMVERGADGKRLAFWLLGVDRGEAGQFFTGISERYPTLAAVSPEYTAINSGQYGNRLNELYIRLSRTGSMPGCDAAALGEYVVKALRDAGFENITLATFRHEDGTVRIEVDATLKDADLGREQEDMEAAGDQLGESIYQRVLDEVVLPTAN